MKKHLFVSLIILFTAVIWAEDLGEVAKKEKARREELKKQGKKATVLTNQDVKNIKSSLGIESNTPVEEPTSSVPSLQSEPATAIQEAIDESNAQLEQLRLQKSELTKEIQITSDSLQQGGVHSSNIGEQYREKRLKEEELKKIEARIEELEKQKKETPDKEEDN